MRFNDAANTLLDQTAKIAITFNSISSTSAIKSDLRDQIIGHFGVAGQNWQLIRIYQIKNGRPHLKKSTIRDSSGIDKIRADRDWNDRLGNTKIDFQTLTNGNSFIKKVSGTEGLIVFGHPLVRSLEGAILEVSVVVLSDRALSEQTSDDRSKIQGVIDLKDKSTVYSTSHLSTFDLDVLIDKISASTGMTQKLTVNLGGAKQAVTATQLIGDVWSFSALPDSVITVPMREALRWSLALGLAILALAISLTVAMALRFTRPVEVLTSLMSRIGKGDFNVKAASKIKTGDEIEFLASSLDQMTTGLKERDKVKNLFQKFHGSEITQDLMTRDIVLGGQSKDIVVFFSDIRGFTTLSEQLSPDVVVSILNRYFSRMVRVILESGGIVDKFVGDAIMAFWGHNKMNDDITRAAYNACLKMKIELASLNKELESEGLPTIKIGMGLHRGKAVVGTIGSEDRMEFTSIGDTINTAARVESLTKEYKTDLLITEPIFNCLDSGTLTELGEVLLKGKQQAVRIYGQKAA
jgi:adenylate cyclase